MGIDYKQCAFCDEMFTNDNRGQAHHCAECSRDYCTSECCEEVELIIHDENDLDGYGCNLCNVKELNYEEMWNDLKSQVDNKYKEMKDEYNSVRDMSTKESSYDTGIHFGSYLATKSISRLMEKLDGNIE